MSQETKDKIISAWWTFFTVFIVAIATYIVDARTIEFTNTFFVSLLIAGVRAGIKELVVRYAPVSLGGKR
ncbi:MAG: hypothetical protein ACP5N7_05840 [Candidatus Pacearchaeota archaeon]